MQITTEEQAWAIEGLHIILRRLEYHRDAFESLDPAVLSRTSADARACRDLINRFEKLTFEG